jgi:V8-like Glu-specific endopeptidase
MFAKRNLFGAAFLGMATVILAAVPSETAHAQTAAIGKLFFSNSSGNYSCTASVVSGKNIIVTAAHCCFDRPTNSWFGAWAFAPGYNAGKAPYGVFNWADARVPTSWVNNGDIPSDVCLIRLQPDSAGHPVTYYTGWLGRAWNFSPNQNMTTFGYPGNIGGANNLEMCVAPSSAQPPSCGPGVLNMACNMTYGSSGGPWIMDWGHGNHVDATVHGWSGTTCTGPFGQVFNGPQFTSNNIVMLCNAEGC